MNTQPKKVIGHIEERNGTRVFVIDKDNRGIPEKKKDEIVKSKVDIKKYRPEFINNIYKD